MKQQIIQVEYAAPKAIPKHDVAVRLSTVTFAFNPRKRQAKERTKLDEAKQMF